MLQASREQEAVPVDVDEAGYGPARVDGLMVSRASEKIKRHVSRFTSIRVIISSSGMCFGCFQGCLVRQACPRVGLYDKEHLWACYIQLHLLKGNSTDEKIIKYIAKLIFLNNRFKSFQLDQSRLAVKIFLALRYFTTKHHFQSTKLVQDRISKIHNLLPTVPNAIKL